MTEPSISDLLRRLGFAHRPAPGWINAREVFHVETGERLGFMTAAEAMEFVEVFGAPTAAFPAPKAKVFRIDRETELELIRRQHVEPLFGLDGTVCYSSFPMPAEVTVRAPRARMDGLDMQDMVDFDIDGSGPIPYSIAMR